NLVSPIQVRRLIAVRATIQIAEIGLVDQPDDGDTAWLHDQPGIPGTGLWSTLVHRHPWPAGGRGEIAVVDGFPIGEGGKRMNRIRVDEHEGPALRVPCQIDTAYAQVPQRTGRAAHQRTRLTENIPDQAVFGSRRGLRRKPARRGR